MWAFKDSLALTTSAALESSHAHGFALDPAGTENVPQALLATLDVKRT